MNPDARIALLIDADNSPSAKIDVILAELAKFGVANIRRAYGNWKKSELKGWEAILHEYAIRPIQQFDHSKGKNATDMIMAIDALDLLYTDRPDAFGLVSSDADFTPLVLHLRAKGATVYGFGAKKTPMPFVNACSRFLYLESLGEDEDDEGEVPAKRKPAAASKKPAANELKRDAKLVSLLRNAVDAAAGEDGWSTLAAVGTQIANQASFDSRNYGFRKLVDLIEATQLFETDRRARRSWCATSAGPGAGPPPALIDAFRAAPHQPGRKPSIDK